MSSAITPSARFGDYAVNATGTVLDKTNRVFVVVYIYYTCTMVGSTTVYRNNGVEPPAVQSYVSVRTANGFASS